MKYFSANLYVKMLNCAIAEGMDKNEFEKLQTPLSKINEIQAVPAEEFFELHEWLDNELGPGFGVRVGQQMKIEDYGVLGLSWRTCSWAGEIFERSERYFKLLSDTFMWQIVESNGISEVRLNRETHRRGLELSTEASLSATVVVMQAVTEKNIRPIQVSFKHGPPSNMEHHNKAFQCEILFNQEHYSISYRTKDLHSRTAKADKSINRFLVERVQEETENLEIAGNKLVFELNEIITDALPSGIPSVDHVAELIGMSRRTLTRRLSEAGFTFRNLVKAKQQEIAKTLLHDNSRSIAEIAFETGFSEQSAFNRAFKSWTGLSPLQYRKN
ncbi:AraC family transcriptional regulator [Aureicoccus marinus]|nr:AraC family transcriptional regulator [Aureicoccus marinus]